MPFAYVNKIIFFCIGMVFISIQLTIILGLYSIVYRRSITQVGNTHTRLDRVVYNVLNNLLQLNTFGKFNTYLNKN